MTVTIILEAASARVRKAFAQGGLPAGTQAEISAAYQGMADEPLPVAVRSSATAEDLPEMSFAGQQDTFLNIQGEVQLLRAVVQCWSSLWTARAIGYRLRNHIADEDAALAVVVQQMVTGEVSGVLLTANPLSGLRSEMVIDATFGLGEALVSGQVEPDHYVLEAQSGALVSSQLGAKKISMHGKAGGGLEVLKAGEATRETLDAAMLNQLAQAGRTIQQEYRAPQDIEWAFAGGRLFILQSRAITSLFPIPEISLDSRTTQLAPGEILVCPGTDPAWTPLFMSAG